MALGIATKHPRLTAVPRFLAPATVVAGALACGGVSEPPPPTDEVVALHITPEAGRLSPYETEQFTAFGERADGTTVAVPVTWSTTAFAGSTVPNSISPGGLFQAGTAIGPFTVTAALEAGSLAASAPVSVHATAGEPEGTFARPVAGTVQLCVSDHFTDDGVLGGEASITASPSVGVVTGIVSYQTNPDPLLFPDGSGAVRVECQQVWRAPSGLVGPVTVRIGVAPARSGSAVAKIFRYSRLTCTNGDGSVRPCGRTDFTAAQSFEPGWATAPVADSVTVTAGEGATIWFKSTMRP